ncbi:hypothetical protein LRS74_28680 [Streptomyces sp. LX-29]|uniref:hypothetical protein n=1 Tax=Streptomyces sp. LX-29 TaxID=2900152 RepID=UPI00240E809F|nr:hypothetical protein [Streptomyces sp. LX-29]WFB10566.1 hypothetical protein LRS74_28680 [Streptomyces sp. LX-29]
MTDAPRDVSAPIEERLVGLVRQGDRHPASRRFARGDRVRFTAALVGAYPHLEDGLLQDPGERGTVRHRVYPGATGTVTWVRPYATPFPYRVRLDDTGGAEVGARELDLEALDGLGGGRGRGHLEEDTTTPR